MCNCGCTHRKCCLSPPQFGLASRDSGSSPWDGVLASEHFHLPFYEGSLSHQNGCLFSFSVATCFFLFVCFLAVFDCPPHFRQLASHSSSCGAFCHLSGSAFGHQSLSERSCGFASAKACSAQGDGSLASCDGGVAHGSCGHTAGDGRLAHGDRGLATSYRGTTQRQGCFAFSDAGVPHEGMNGAAPEMLPALFQSLSFFCTLVA